MVFCLENQGHAHGSDEEIVYRVALSYNGKDMYQLPLSSETGGEIRLVSPTEKLARGDYPLLSRHD